MQVGSEGHQLVSVSLVSPPPAASVLGSCLQPAPAQTPVTTTPPSTVQIRSPTSPVLSTVDLRVSGKCHLGSCTDPGPCLSDGALGISPLGRTRLGVPLCCYPPVMLSLFPEILPKPTVTPGQIQVLENWTFTLTCNGSPSANTVLWLRDEVSLAPSERLVLSSGNRTLKVLGVTRGDAGAYQCEVGNPVITNRSEPSTVTLAYGPDSAQIDPPGSIALTLGSLLNLTCVADSVPALSYRWVLNGTDTKETGSSLTFNLTTWAQQGTYECRAHNPVTGRTAWASVAVWVTGSGESLGWSNTLQTQGSQCWHQCPSAMLEGLGCREWGGGIVAEPSDPNTPLISPPDVPRPGAPSALSAWAIAGIVIGSLVGAALVGVTSLRKRINGHKSDIRNHNTQKPMGEHFNLSNHSVTDLKVAILQQKNFKNRLQRETAELN
uniref:Ig-like domain-containing protein n=1 Tax=Chrysemys picta bellii TaxID=8478 RepID=A0A8C3FIP3_CHRPI